jgi:hypothetical protein
VRSVRGLLCGRGNVGDGCGELELGLKLTSVMCYVL